MTSCLLKSLQSSIRMCRVKKSLGNLSILGQNLQYFHPSLFQPFSTVVTGSKRSSQAEELEESRRSKERRMMDIDAINKEYKAEIDEIMNKYDEKRKRKQQIVGIVTSAKTNKTINVTYVHDKYMNKYNTTMTVKRKVMAHDENEICAEGDLVRVIPCAPVSRRKRHKLIDIIKKADKLQVSITRSMKNTINDNKVKEKKEEKLAKLAKMNANMKAGKGSDGTSTSSSKSKSKPVKVGDVSTNRTNSSTEKVKPVSKRS